MDDDPASRAAEGFFVVLIRLALSVVAFFVASFAVFLLVGNFFWSDSSQSQDFPTPQDILNMITTTCGVVAAAATWFATRRWSLRGRGLVE